MAFWNRNDAQKDIDEQLQELDTNRRRAVQQYEGKYHIPQQGYTPPRVNQPAGGTARKQDTTPQAKLLLLLLGVLGIILVTAVVLIAILEGDYDDSYGEEYIEYTYYEDSEDFWQLQQAQAGDTVAFGNANWQVAYVGYSEILLVCMNEVPMNIDEEETMLSRLNVYEYTENEVHYLLPELRFSYEEHARIIEKSETPDEEAVGLLRLSEDEMIEYDLEPNRQIEDHEWVRPAVWVNIWNEAY